MEYLFYYNYRDFLQSNDLKHEYVSTTLFFVDIKDKKGCYPFSMFSETLFSIFQLSTRNSSVKCKKIFDITLKIVVEGFALYL